MLKSHGAQDRVIDWMVLYATFNSSQCSCLSWVSSVLGWGSEVTCPKTERIQCGSNPGPLDNLAMQNPYEAQYKTYQFTISDAHINLYI